jgi:hypothetical protein
MYDHVLVQEIFVRPLLGTFAKGLSFPQADSDLKYLLSKIFRLLSLKNNFVIKYRPTPTPSVSDIYLLLMLKTLRKG